MSRVVLGAAVSLLLLVGGGWVAPSSAHAYTGEGFVETVPGGGAGDSLTGAARSIITNPTFLETEPGAAAAAGDGDTLLGAEVASGILPEMSAVLPWVAGAAIGAAVVCNLELFGSCLEFFGSGTDPAKSEKITWNRAETLVEGNFSGTGGTGTYMIMPGNYYTTNQGTFAAEEKEATGKECSSLKFPIEATGGFTSSHSIFCGGTFTAPDRQPWKSQFTNRAVRATGAKTATYTGSGYCAVGGACSSKSPVTWGEKFAQCLHSGAAKCGMTEAQAGRLGQAVAHAVEPKVHSPYATYVNVPSCDELTWGACKAALEGEELKPVREDIDWTEVETTTPAEVLELEPANRLKSKKAPRSL